MDAKEMIEIRKKLIITALDREMDIVEKNDLVFEVHRNYQKPIKKISAPKSSSSIFEKIGLDQIK